MKKFEPFEIVKVLNDIFLVYSTSGPNLDLMSSKNFLQFYSDCQVNHEKLSKQSAELILASEQRKSKFVTFEVFLSILTRISKIIYPDPDETSTSIYRFLDRHIISLYNSIDSDIKLIDVLNLSTLEILGEVSEMIGVLYKSEFTWEIFNSFDVVNIRKSSQSKVLALMKTLRIFPDLISYTKTLKILKLVINNQDFAQSFPFTPPPLGTVFTLKHFITYLYYLCEHSTLQEEDPGKKLALFFQHIEAWLPESSPVKFSLLNLPKVLNYAQEAETVEVSDFKSHQALECLESVFRIYSIWQEKIKKHTMNLIRFLTFTNDAGLSGKVNRRDLELLFCKLTSNKGKKSREHGKMDFSMFCLAINEVSLRVVNKPHALKTFCKENLAKLVEKSYENEVKAVVMMIKEHGLLDIVLVLGQVLRAFFRYYMNENELMNFENFFRFCKDFSVFPDLIQMKKLTPIFYTLASAYANNAMMLTGTKSLEKLLMTEDEYLEPQFINFDLFVEAISVCALEANSINRTSEQKLSFAICKISQSPGASEICRKSGHTRSTLTDMNSLIADNEPDEKSKKLTFIDYLKHKP